MTDAQVATAPPGSALWRAALALRIEVFVGEQGVPLDLERDAYDDDPETRHLVVTGNDAVLAAVRWIREPTGYEGLAPRLGAPVHLQRLAVAVQWRGRGLGRALVDAVERDARDIGAGVVYLAAQRSAVPFYERLQYEAYGAPFVEAGIDHRHMMRTLGPSAARPREGGRPAG